MSLSVVRHETEHLLGAGERLVDSARAAEAALQERMRLGSVGPEIDGRAEIGEGRLELSEVQHHESEAQVRLA